MRRDVPDRSLRRPGRRAGAAGLGLAALIVGLAGCGGGGDSTSAASGAAQGTTTSATTTSSTTGTGGGGNQAKRVSPQERVRIAVEAVLASDNPADACGRYVTQHYLSLAYGSRQGCVKAQTPGSAADKLDFKSLRIDGATATAVVVPSGGPYDGERITVSLVRDFPHWAVDELRSNVPVGP